MKKRLAALIMAAVMAVTFCACGGSDDEEEEPAATNAEESAGVEDMEESAPSDEDGEAADGEELAPEEEAPAEDAAVSGWRPDSPVTIVVPYATGSVADASARVLAQYAEKYMGQVVYLENVAGDTPAYGWSTLKGRDSDGLTLGVIDLPAFNNSIVQGLQSYGTRSFDMICNHVTEPDVIVVRKSDNRFRSLDDLVKYGQENQWALVAATDGEGAPNHIATQAFAKSAEFVYNVNHVGGAQNQLQSLRDATSDFCVVTVANIVERDTDLRVLGVFARERLEAYPDVPTLEELGYYPDEMGVFRCIVAPAGVSDEMVDYYESVFQLAMEDPAYVEASAGITTDFRTSEETAELLRRQQAFVRSLDAAFWTIDVPAPEAPVEG